MKKSGWKFLVGIVLIAVVFGACAEPFGPPEDPVEYDAQGRRLVTINVDVEKAARAVNLKVAKAYIDFYEVVFVRVGTPNDEYYSATTTKGAGKRLSLRVPVTGTYQAYLFAGHLEDSDNAVLLAQATDDNGSLDPVDNHDWTFSLTALKLQVNGPTNPATTPGTGMSSVSTNPIYVEIGAGAGSVFITDGKIPYYKLPNEDTPVLVTVKTGVTIGVSYGTDNISIVPLGETSPHVDLSALIKDGTDDIIPSIAAVSGPPEFVGGVLTFGFQTPLLADFPTKGESNIGFDVSVALVNYDDRVNPFQWHIRNGLEQEEYDNGVDDETNTGIGLVFAWGTTIPAASTESTGVSMAFPTTIVATP
jgi:hypothetical protein